MSQESGNRSSTKPHPPNQHLHNICFLKNAAIHCTLVSSHIFAVSIHAKQTPLYALSSSNIGKEGHARLGLLYAFFLPRKNLSLGDI